MRRALLALPLLLVACATGPTLAERLGGFVGMPEAELVARLGVPDRQAEVQGRRFVTYATQRDELVPGGFGPGFGGYGFRRWPVDNVVRTRCEVTFEVTGGAVRGASHRGDGCWGSVIAPGARVATLP